MEDSVLKMDKITVSLKRLREIVNNLKILPDDNEVSFTYVVGSCFPNLYKNVMDSLKDSYTEGYIQGLKDAKNENQGNSI